MTKRKVIFSKISEEKLESLLNYLELEWSITVKKRFITKLNNCFKQIDNFPNSNQYSETLKMNKCKVSKQTSFFYTVTEKEIFVSFFIDNRMNN